MATLMEIDVLIEQTAMTLATFPTYDKESEEHALMRADETAMIQFRHFLYSTNAECLDFEKSVEHIQSIRRKYSQ